MPLLTTKKPVTDGQFKTIYAAWISMRKKNNNPLLRCYWRKPDQNDNSPNASFRSRVADKMQTRRKNKNDSSNYMKLKLLSKEIFAGRCLIAKVMEREKLKLALLDLDYMELKQMLKEKSQPDYKCEEFKDFMTNEGERTKVDLPPDLVQIEKSDSDSEMDPDGASLYDDISNNSSKNRSKLVGIKELNEEQIPKSLPLQRPELKEIKPVNIERSQGIPQPKLIPTPPKV